VIFDVLAFRSDIGFWKGKETMSGLSSRAVISSAAQTVIIYLYLLDADNLNSIVLATYTFSTAVELWKVVPVLLLLPEDVELLAPPPLPPELVVVLEVILGLIQLHRLVRFHSLLMVHQKV
jgi:hypothetical protein